MSKFTDLINNRKTSGYDDPLITDIVTERCKYFTNLLKTLDNHDISKHIKDFHLYEYEIKCGNNRPCEEYQQCAMLYPNKDYYPNIQLCYWKDDFLLYIPSENKSFRGTWEYILEHLNKLIFYESPIIEGKYWFKYEGD